MKFEIGNEDIHDEDIDDNSEKYRQYMSWVPKEEENEEHTPEKVKLSKG